MEKLQPNSRQCFVCGLANPFGLQLRFYVLGPGELEVSYTVPEHYQGFPGMVHGGIVAAMLDEVCGRVFIGEAPPRFMYTARLEVRYRQHVPVGVPLRLVGHAVKDRGRAATATAEIYAPDGVLLAEAEALLVNVPPDLLGGVDLEALGWKVYDDQAG